MRHLCILFVGLICFSCWGTGGEIYKFYGPENISHTVKKGWSDSSVSAAVRLIGFSSDSIYIEMASIPEDQYHNKRIGIKGETDTVIYFSNFYTDKLKIDYLPTSADTLDVYIYADVSFAMDFK